MGVMGVGEMGIGETGVGEMGVSKTGKPLCLVVGHLILYDFIHVGK